MALSSPCGFRARLPVSPSASFVNVLGIRVPLRRSVVSPGSASRSVLPVADRVGTTTSLLSLAPAARGPVPGSCKAAIGVRYPAVGAGDRRCSARARVLAFGLIREAVVAAVRLLPVLVAVSATAIDRSTPDHSRSPRLPGSRGRPRRDRRLSVRARSGCSARSAPVLPLRRRPRVPERDGDGRREARAAPGGRPGRGVAVALMIAMVTAIVPRCSCSPATARRRARWRSRSGPSSRSAASSRCSSASRCSTPTCPSSKRDGSSRPPRVPMTHSRDMASDSTPILRTLQPLPARPISDTIGRREGRTSARPPWPISSRPPGCWTPSGSSSSRTGARRLDRRGDPRRGARIERRARTDSPSATACPSSTSPRRESRRGRRLDPAARPRAHERRPVRAVRRPSERRDRRPRERLRDRRAAARHPFQLDLAVASRDDIDEEIRRLHAALEAPTSRTAFDVDLEVVEDDELETEDGISDARSSGSSTRSSSRPPRTAPATSTSTRRRTRSSSASASTACCTRSANPAARPPAG